MTDIKIAAWQISEVLYETELVEGKNRLPKYHHFLGRLEGIPTVERIGKDSYRLITYYENYLFYKRNKPFVPFACELIAFTNEEDRYLELLITLFHGKARSATKDKYYIINFLHITLEIEEIASQLGMDAKDINRFIYENDKYKHCRVQALKTGRHSLAEDVVKYLKKYDIFKEETEDYLLNLGTKLTQNYRKIIKFVLERISSKFFLLPSDEQIGLLNEMKDPGMKILNNHFNERCNELLFIPPDGDDYNRPTIQ